MEPNCGQPISVRTDGFRIRAASQDLRQNRYSNQNGLLMVPCFSSRIGRGGGTCTQNAPERSSRFLKPMPRSAYPSGFLVIPVTFYFPVIALHASSTRMVSNI